MPIVKICQGQPSLAVRIVTPGCNGGQVIDYKQLRLVIMSPPAKRCELPLSPQHFSGFYPTHDVDKWNESFILPEEEPLLIYPAFDVNDNGDIVFRLDRQMWCRRGRYVGVIETIDGRKLVELDLDISTQQYIADTVTVNSYSCGG